MILARIADITQPAPGSGSFMIPLVILLLYPGIFLIRNPEAIFLIFLANIFCYFIFGTIIGLIIYFIKSRTIKPKLGLEN
jgi:Na+/H+-dicarboxylate symporter